MTAPAAHAMLWRDLPDFNELRQDVWSAEALTVCLLSHLRTHETAPGLQPEEYRHTLAMTRTLQRALSAWFGPLACVVEAGRPGDLVPASDLAGLPPLLALADDLADAEGVARVLAHSMAEAYVGGIGEPVFRSVTLVASILARARGLVCSSPAFVELSKGGAV